MPLTKWSSPSSANSASGAPCTPAAVVKTIEVFTRPVRLSRPPISIWSGACQSKSKLMSAAVRRAAHLASVVASKSGGVPV